jgi:hypothetical protein
MTEKENRILISDLYYVIRMLQEHPQHFDETDLKQAKRLVSDLFSMAECAEDNHRFNNPEIGGEG